MLPLVASHPILAILAYGMTRTPETRASTTDIPITSTLKPACAGSSPVTVPLGNVARLTCPVETGGGKAQLARVTWNCPPMDHICFEITFDPGQDALRNQNRWMIDSDESVWRTNDSFVFKLAAVTPSQAGIYTCTVERLGNITERYCLPLAVSNNPGTLVLYARGVQTMLGKDTGYLTPGETLELLCTAHPGEENSTISWWEHQTNMAPSVSAPLGVITTLSLNLGRVTADLHRRQFTCDQDLNGVIRANETVTVLVRKPPDSIAIHPTQITDLEGREINATCIATGADPMPFFEWKLGGRSLRRAESFSEELPNNTFASTLRFRLAISYHGVNLACYAITPNLPDRTLQAWSRVQVIHKPVVRVSPDLVVLSEGETATLECHSTAFPAVREIQWGRKNSSDPKGMEKIVGTNATLQLGNLQIADAGIYRCKATNGVGHTTSTGISVTVLSGSTFTATRVLAAVSLALLLVLAVLVMVLMVTGRCSRIKQGWLIPESYSRVRNCCSRPRDEINNC